MVKERFLKRSEFGKFLECYCRDPGPPMLQSAKHPRYGGGSCTCTIAEGSKGKGPFEGSKRKRPFRVGYAVIVRK